MGITSDPLSFHDKHLFQVSIDGFGYSGWQKASALEGEIATIEHWEGAAIAAHKRPGRITFSDITLERGSTRDLDMYDWFEETANAAANAGGVDPTFIRNGDLIVLDRDQVPIVRWPLVEIWPKKFVAGDWDNTVDEKVITSLVLSIHHFERPLILRAGGLT